MKHKAALLLGFFGVFSWVLTMVKSNLPTGYDGIGFWGANGHDGIWHIALSQSLLRGSFEIPVFSGYILKNYHIGFDVILALLSLVTRISIPTLYFQIIPPVLAILLAYSVYRFVLSWKKDSVAAWWSMFFVFFGGSAGWIITLFRGQGFGGESMFWSQQAISTLINPPFALSLIFLLLGMMSFESYLTKGGVKHFSLTVFFFGFLITIKSYLGILALVSLLLVSLIQVVLRQPKSKNFFLVFLSSLFISVLLFIPLNRFSTGLLVFKPFWFLETMLGLSDRLGWPRAYEALMNWRSGGIWVKAAPAMMITFAIFVIGNLGSRIIFLVHAITLVRKYKSILWQDLFLLSIATGGVLAPTLFLQQGTPWNTIQFFYYTLFVCSIYSGFVMSMFSRQLSTQKYRLLAVLVVLVTIPTTLSTLLTVYLPGRPPAKISTHEAQALDFLSKQPSGIVLTYPFDSIAASQAVNNPPRPLYLYDSTAYVSAYSNKPVYLEDEVNLTIMGYPWKERRILVEKFYKEPDQYEARYFLSSNNVTYIYWHKGQRALLGDKQLGLKRIFENEEIDIYTVIPLLGDIIPGKIQR